MGKEFAITKVADEQQIVLGWANVSVTADGTPIEDYQHDMIEPEELERAAYEYVLKFRDTGEGHNPKLRKKGKLVESVVFTKEKLEAMGIPEGVVPLGWWIGFKIEDKSTWDKVKKGEYTMFSIEGTGEREPVEKAMTFDEVMAQTCTANGIMRTAKTFDEIMKFNPNHDELGRFAPTSGGSAGEDGRRARYFGGGKTGASGPSPTGTNEFEVKGFGSKQKLNNHWQNGRTHRAEYDKDGITTKEQDVQRALELVQSATSENILGHVDKDGSVIRYDKKKNDFVKGQPDKGITTMYKPVDGLRYYEDQRRKDLEHGGRDK